MDWKKFHHSGPVPKYLTQEELEKFFRAIDNFRDFAMFNLIYRYGLRVSEVGLLLVDDLNLEENLISITRLKKSQSEVYDLTIEIKNILKTYLSQRKERSIYLFPSRERKPISRNQIFTLYRKYYDKAGLKIRHKRHPHCLRHSMAVHSVDANTDIMYIKHLLGHKSINSTLLYTVVSGNKMLAELHRLKRSPWIVKPPTFLKKTPTTVFPKDKKEGNEK